MTDLIVTVKNNDPYPILLRDDFSDLGRAVSLLPDMQGRKICIVSDSKVDRKVLRLKKSLSEYQ